MIPLYQLNQSTWTDLARKETAHPGLVFDKFPDGWTTPGSKLPDSAKSDLYEVTARRSQTHLEAGITHFIERQTKLVKAQDGVKRELHTNWRLITGLGNSHPYETGFIWHKTLGVPYLAGSSIKGLLRDWITNWTDEREEEIDRLLGPSEPTDTKPAHVGAIIIFDALPTKPPKLEVDILTPHYQPYYSNSLTAYPADYYSPVPVKFLTVAAGNSFLFAITPRPGTGTKEDSEKCINYLLEALETLGAGGKTAVGYGVMTESLYVSRQREEQKQVATAHKEAEAVAHKSGLPEELMPMITDLEENNWRTNNIKFYEGAEKWLPKIRQNENVVAQKNAAQKLANILDCFQEGIMLDPNKTRGKKKKPAYKARHVGIAEQLLEILNAINNAGE